MPRRGNLDRFPHGTPAGGRYACNDGFILRTDSMNTNQTMTPPVNTQADIKLRTEIRERTLGYMLAAFGLVAGLAWNDAIQTLISYLYPLPENTLPAKFMYAVIISIVVVVISVSMSRLFHRLTK